MLSILNMHPFFHLTFTPIFPFINGAIVQRIGNGRFLSTYTYNTIHPLSLRRGKSYNPPNIHSEHLNGTCCRIFSTISSCLDIFRSFAKRHVSRVLCLITFKIMLPRTLHLLSFRRVVQNTTNKWQIDKSATIKIGDLSGNEKKTPNDQHRHLRFIPFYPIYLYKDRIHGASFIV